MLDAAPACRLDAHNPLDDLGCYCNSTPRIGWVVATTHPQAERWADTNLRRRGYRTYLPLVAARRQDRAVRSLWHTVQRPLFGPYLFVWFDSRNSWRPIYETPGVHGVIKCGSEIQWCSDAVIEAVRSAVDAAEAVSAASPLWKPGTPCTLSVGPLAGMPAVVTKVSREPALWKPGIPRDMATVAILMFGHLREVSVQLDCLTRRDE